MTNLTALGSLLRPDLTERVVQALQRCGALLIRRRRRAALPLMRGVQPVRSWKRRHHENHNLHPLFGLTRVRLEANFPSIGGPAFLLLLACASGCHAHRVSYGPEVALPLVHTSADTRRIYVAADANGDQVWFLDTGHPVTTCDAGLIEHLGLESFGRRAYAGIMGKGVASLADLPALELGEHRVEGVRCMVRDLTTTSSVVEPQEVAVAGILGMDVLSHFRFGIDLTAGTLTLRPPARDDRDMNTPIRWSPLSRRMKVETHIGPVDLRMIVDTGATDTLLDGEAHGLIPSHAGLGQWLRGSGQSDDPKRTLSHYQEEVVLSGLELGRIELTGLPRGPSLLGLDVLGLMPSEWSPKYRRAHFSEPSPAQLPLWSEWKERDEPTAFRLQ